MKSTRPFTLLIKPVGSRCNLDCSYCFYQGNDELLGGNRPAVMPDHVLERLVEDYLGLGFPTSVFTWQGGEPTLAGLDFYRKVVDRQMALGQGGQAVSNGLQTNGLLIDQEWAEFLAEYRFLVGLSLDGPPEIHDHFRKDKAGRPSFAKVLEVARLLQRQRVEFNVLCMITGRSEQIGRQIYRFLVGEGFCHLQFIPCVEYDPHTGAPSPHNVSPRGYGVFMSEVFDEWYPQDVGRVCVRTFDALVGGILGEEFVTLCNLGRLCHHYLVVEKDGGVYPCDFFVKERYCLGNLTRTSLAELFLGDREMSFARLKSQYPESCGRCSYLHLCYGGCPKDRLTAGGGKFNRPSAICEGLKYFFERNYEHLAALAESVRRSRAPALADTGAAAGLSPGRNDPCPCGSGKKFKHCCLEKQRVLG